MSWLLNAFTSADGTPPPSDHDKRAPRVFYGWWLLGAGLAAMTVISATTWQATGTFLVALEEEFDWSRTILSGAFAIARAEGAVMGPFEGLLTDRLGGRRTMLIGFLVCGGGFFLFTGIRDPVTFYLAYLVITIGAGLAGFIPMITIVNNWFVRNRTRAMSVIFVGGSLGGAFNPLLAWGIENYGWRWVSGGIGGFYMLVTLPIVLLIRDRPERYGLRPDGDPPDAPEEAPSAGQRPRSRVQPAPDYTPRQALRTRAFWIIAVAHACSATVFSTMTVHLVPFLTDQGLSLTTAGLAVLLMAIVSGVFQAFGGWLGDRMDKRYVVFGFMIIHGLGTLFLLLVNNLRLALVYAVFTGVGHGGRGPATTSLRGDYFGRRSFGTIMGLSALPMNIGSIAVPLITGIVFDMTNSYRGPFLALGLLIFAGAALMLFLGPPQPPPAVRRNPPPPDLQAHTGAAVSG